jgi:hypothetical protein
MDVRVHQPGKDHQIAEVVVCGVFTDLNDHALLPTHGGRAYLVFHNHTLGAQ